MVWAATGYSSDVDKSGPCLPKRGELIVGRRAKLEVGRREMQMQNEDTKKDLVVQMSLNSSMGDDVQFEAFGT